MKHLLLFLACLMGSLTTSTAVEVSEVLQAGRYNGLIVVTVTDPTYKVKQSVSARLTTRLRADGVFDGFFLVSSAPTFNLYTTAQGEDETIHADLGFPLLNFLQNADSALIVESTFSPSNPAYLIDQVCRLRSLSNGRRSKCKLTSKAVSLEDSVNFATSDPAHPGTYSISVKLTWAGS